MSSTSISASEAPPRRARPEPVHDPATPMASGRGEVRIARSGAHSVVARAFATSPLRLLTPGNDGHAAWVFTSSFGGGLVDGDRLSLDVNVGDGAAAFISTQASTKVYRSPIGTSAQLRAQVGRNGLLVSVPDPVVCFADSRFDQHQTFDLAPDAALVAVDWVTSGRRESGERCRFAHYCSRVIVRVDGRLVIHDALALRQEDGELPVRLGRFDVLAVAMVIGGVVSSAGRALVKECDGRAVERRPEQLVVASAVENGRSGDIGCVLRIAGPSVEAVGRTLRTCLSFVPPVLGDDPWARKW